MDQVFAFLGQFALYTAGAVGVSAGLFKVFGERLINDRFDRAMENVKAEHNRELEHLRFQISGLLDRVTRLNNREFEVLPEAWAKLLAAYNATFVHTSSGRMGNNLNAMDDAAFEAFLEISPLLDFQKDRVRQAKDRNEEYFELIYLHDKPDTRQLAQQFSSYLQSHGIFIRSKDRFKQLDDMIWEALRQHALIREHRIMPKPGASGIEALEVQGKALLEALDSEIHHTLWATDIAPKKSPALPQRQ